MTREKTPFQAYSWPLIQAAASTANAIGMAATMAGDSESASAPAFKTGLATSGIYAAANLLEVARIYNERNPKETFVEKEEARRAEAAQLAEIVIQK